MQKFDLKLEKQVIKHYCKQKISKLEAASIDRINSNKGYIKENIQLLCQKINIMKFDLSHQEFIKLCHIISNHNKNE